MGRVGLGWGGRGCGGELLHRGPQFGGAFWQKRPPPKGRYSLGCWPSWAAAGHGQEATWAGGCGWRGRAALCQRFLARASATDFRSRPRWATAGDPAPSRPMIRWAGSRVLVRGAPVGNKFTSLNVFFPRAHLYVYTRGLGPSVGVPPSGVVFVSVLINIA